MTKQPLIYLAIPYTHDDPSVRQARFELVNQVAAKLIKEGHLVYSPISHSHPIALDANMNISWEVWKELGLAMLEKCDEMCVLTEDGWLESEGVQEEIKYAKTLGMFIWYIHPEGFLEPGYYQFLRKITRRLRDHNVGEM